MCVSYMGQIAFEEVLNAYFNLLGVADQPGLPQWIIQQEPRTLRLFDSLMYFSDSDNLSDTL